jgi:hypothetical protein
VAKIKIEQTDSAISITLPVKRNWNLFIFLGFWLFAWAIGEQKILVVMIGGFSGFIAGIKAMASQGIPIAIFLFVWLCVWTAGGVFAVIVWFYQLKGKEIITRDSNYLYHVRNFVIFKRAKTYENKHIKNMRLSPPPSGIFTLSPERALEFCGMGGGSITFDYGSKIIQIGTGLEGTEVPPVIDGLKKIAQ